MSNVELAKLTMLNRALDWLANPPPKCCICNRGVDPHGAHKIINSDHAHVHCAETYDAQDLGSLPDLADPMGSGQVEPEEEYE